MMVPETLALMVPFIAIGFAAGVVFARWSIIRNPGQVGLKKRW